MNTKSFVRECFTHFSNRSRVKSFAFGAITAALFAYGNQSVSAQTTYTNLAIDPTGNVTLQAGKTSNDYNLLDNESILGTESTRTFTFNEQATTAFTNNGTIGSSEAANQVNSLDMSSIGQFVNMGTVTFNDTLSVSAAGLNNTGTINGNNSFGISSNGLIINNSGGVLTGTIAKSTGITNSGEIRGLLGTSTLITSGNLVNDNIITGYSSIIADILTNTTNASIDLSDTISITTSITNSGTMENVETISSKELINTISGLIKNADSLTATESLINYGDINNVESINANTSLINYGNITNDTTIITNDTTIIANRELTNRGTISDFTDIELSGGQQLKNSGTLRNIKKISGNLSLAEPGRIEMTGESYETTITGNLTSSDGTFAVRINPHDEALKNDVFSVKGNVVINGGSIEITDDTDGTGIYKSGDTWMFIKSPGTLRVNEDLTIIEDPNLNLSPLLEFNTSYDNSNYYLYVQRTKVYAPDAQTNNQYQFGRYLDTLGKKFVDGSDLENVLFALDNLSPGQNISPAAKHAMAQMDGAVYGSMATMEVQNMTIVNNTLTNYLRPKGKFCDSPNSDSSNPDGISPCPGMKFWGSYYGVNGNAKADGNSYGGDYSVNGVLVGGDRYISPSLRLGGFFAFGSTEYQVKGLSEQADADSYKVGLYFVRQSDIGYLLGNFNYGWANFNMNRNITFLDRTNSAETYGNEWAFRIEQGFNIPLSRLVFQPFGAFQYLSLDTDAFSETGTGATALNVDKSYYDSYRTEFGGRFLWGFEGQHGTGNAFFQVSWMHEFGDDYGTVTSSFNNTNRSNYTGNYKYTVNGVDLGRDWCNLGIGGDLTRNNITIFGGYDFMVSDKQNLHTGNVGLAYQF